MVFVMAMIASGSTALAADETPGNLAADNHRSHQYGRQARCLRLSRILSSPAIVRQTGTTAAYQHWVCDQPCVITGCTGCNAEGKNHFYPVRQSLKSYDPGYVGVSLCESARYCIRRNGLVAALAFLKQIKDEPEECARAWLQLKAMELLHDWVWTTLKTRLGYRHWYDVPPPVFVEWAKTHNVGYLIPRRYVQIH